MSRNAGNDENGEFGDISPKTKIQANELKTRVTTLGVLLSAVIQLIMNYIYCIKHSHHQFFSESFKFQLLVCFLLTRGRMRQAMSLFIKLLSQTFHFGNCNGKLFLFFHKQRTNAVKLFSCKKDQTLIAHTSTYKLCFL